MAVASLVGTLDHSGERGARVRILQKSEDHRRAGLDRLERLIECTRDCLAGDIDVVQDE